MVGAITFLRNLRDICQIKTKTCIGCPLYPECGTVTNCPQETTDRDIMALVAKVETETNRRKDAEIRKQESQH